MTVDSGSFEGLHNFLLGQVRTDNFATLDCVFENIVFSGGNTNGGISTNGGGINRKTVEMKIWETIS